MTVPSKVCFKCDLDKPLGEFYRHPEMADGHLNKCKECTKRDVREGRSSRREQYAAYEKQRSQREARRTAQVEYLRRSRARNPEKATARNAVSNAIRDGKLDRQPCEVCGRKAEAHHADYSKPLDIRWLCFKHHREMEHGHVVVTQVDR